MCLLRHLPDEFAVRIRDDLAGTGRSLSAATKRDYLAWEERWRNETRPPEVHKALGFAARPNGAAAP